MKFISFILAIALIVFGGAVFFQNCGEQGDTLGNLMNTRMKRMMSEDYPCSLSRNSAETLSQLSYFKLSQEVYGRKFINHTRKRKFAKGTAFTVVREYHCGGNKYETQVANEDLDEAAVERWAQSDPCIEGIEVTPEWSIPPVGPVTTAAAAGEMGSHLSAIRASEGYAIFYGPNGITREVEIAIIDSGVDDHSDLKIDSANGRDAVNRTSNYRPRTSAYTHGTHVAGLAAALENGMGVMGTMNKHVKILPFQVAPTNSPSTINVPAAIWAVKYTRENTLADVMNMSFGGDGGSSALENEITQAGAVGIVTVIAAGNSAENASSFFPANTTAPSAVTVASLDVYHMQGKDLSALTSLSLYSNFSPTFVDIAAPGCYRFTSGGSQTGLKSTWVGNQYASICGTSMASPVTAGAVALIIGLAKSRGKSYTAEQIVQVLLDGSTKATALTSKVKSGNVLDLLKLAEEADRRFPAAAAATPTPTPEDPDPSPTASPKPKPKKKKPVCK